MSATRVAVDEGIAAAARDVGSIIAKHVETTERNRRLAPPVIDALRAAGLFRLFTPRALGGLEVDPVTFARVVEEVSTFDSAAGWAFQVNTGAWWTSRMSPAGVAELYADGPDLMMAASFAPPHRVRSARLFFYDALAKAWERAVAQKPFTLEDKADLMLASTWAVRSAARATDLMHRVAGRTGSMRGAGSNATSATRRRCGTTGSCRAVAWKRSDRSISVSNRSFRSWRFEARGGLQVGHGAAVLRKVPMVFGRACDKPEAFCQRRRGLKLRTTASTCRPHGFA